MIIREITDTQNTELLSVLTLLLGRAEDTGADKRISTDAVVTMANSMGISVTSDTLLDILSNKPFTNIVKNANAKHITFSGHERVDTGMSVDDAEKTVKKMAKRAMKR